MASNTLGEFSDGEDDFVFEIDENVWKNSDPQGWEWSDSEADELIRNINEEEVLARAYGNVDVIRKNDENSWSDPEADDLIRNLDEEEVLARVYRNNNDDDVIRNINEEEVIARAYGNDNDEDEVQTGRGEKRKNESDEESESEDEQSEDEQGQYYYQLESSRKYHSKKFGMTATDHRVRFNNVLAGRDLLESYRNSLKIFHHLLEEVKEGMAPNDQVRFILRSEQLETPISLPFMPVERLTAERVYSELERVIQSNQEFRLNDTVTIDINHVESPVGSRGKGKKRTTYDIDDYLDEKNSVVRIKNNDDLCLARALVVARAKIDKDPKYNQIKQSDRPIQREKAFDLHEAANVPLGPCGLNEVALFQQYLSDYQIVVVSGDHNNSVIYPPPSSGTDEKPHLTVYLHSNHYDVINSVPGFLERCYFCFRCYKAYDHTTDHMCTNMCRSCRGFGCIWENEGMVCRECKRLFKSQRCYDRHKNEPINDGGRTVCQVIRVCEKCDKSMDIRKIRDGGHICGRKCRTCGVVVTREDTDHKCYIQPLEQEEDSSYNHMLFFDFEATQEHGTHCPNLCVVHDEEKEVALFQGKDTLKDFCKWLFTPQHKGCIVVAHNFQGYDGYFITDYLVQNAIKYDIIYRGAKSLSMKVPDWDIKFIDSLNFIPMALAKFPKTFGQDELCKGYFPHAFNKDENQNYVGPIPCQNDYGVNFMKPGERDAFITWYDEQVANNYRYDFREEIIKYCRSDVDILHRCCLQYREMFRKETDIDPFNKSLTIASYCQEVYRTNFLKKDTIAIFNNDRQWKIKQSNVAVTWLSYISEKEDLYIKHVRNGGEKRVAPYSLDGYCEETNTAYEFQGCFWHGCPECFKDRDTVNPVSQKTMEELYMDTKKKVKFLKDQGFRVVEKWGCELEKELEDDEEMKQFFDQNKIVDPLQPRDAFYGGRTNATKLVHKCQGDEKIK